MGKKRRATSSSPKKRPRPGPMTPATAPYPEHPIGPAGRNEQDRLDEALEESFPTSDSPTTRIE